MSVPVDEEPREIQENLLPSYAEKILKSMKAERAVKQITVDRTEANPSKILRVSVPKLDKNEVLVPGSLALRFDIDLSGGEPNNFLVQKVTRALVEKLVVKFVGHILEGTVDYDIYKIFEDLFLSQEKRDDMILEGIQRQENVGR